MSSDRNIRNRKMACQSAVRSFEAHNPLLRAMIEVEKEKSNTLQAEELLQLPQHTREEVLPSPELQWMHIEEDQPESLATGSGGLGTDDTSLIERAVPSSSVAAGAHLLVHLTSSYSTACPGDIRAATKSSKVLVEEPEKWRDTQPTLSSKPGLISEIPGSGD